VNYRFKWFAWSSSLFVCGGSGGCDPSCCGDVPGVAGRAGTTPQSTVAVKPSRDPHTPQFNTLPNFFSANTIHFALVCL